jgi:hypothetical protein
MMRAARIIGGRSVVRKHASHWHHDFWRQSMLAMDCGGVSVSGSFMKCIVLTSDCFYARLGNIRFFKWNLTYRKRTLDE